MFIVGIGAFSLLAPFIAKKYVQIDFTLPIMGTSIVHIPSELLGGSSGIQVSIALSGAFQWTFYLAIATAVLGIVARIFHDKQVVTIPI